MWVLERSWSWFGDGCVQLPFLAFMEVKKWEGGISAFTLMWYSYVISFIMTTKQTQNVRQSLMGGF